MTTQKAFACATELDGLLIDRVCAPTVCRSADGAGWLPVFVLLCCLYCILLAPPGRPFSALPLHVFMQCGYRTSGQPVCHTQALLASSHCGSGAAREECHIVLSHCFRSQCSALSNILSNRVQLAVSVMLICSSMQMFLSVYLQQRDRLPAFWEIVPESILSG